MLSILRSFHLTRYLFMRNCCSVRNPTWIGIQAATPQTTSYYKY